MSDTTEQSEEKPSTRDVLEAAYDHVAEWEEGQRPAEAAGEETPQEGGETPAPPPPTNALGRDGKGRFLKPGKPPGAAPAAAAPAQPGVPPPAAPMQAKAHLAKAPAMWKPVAREQWAALPEPVKEEVVRIARETDFVMRRASEATKFQQEFQTLIKPYESLIAASGRKPLESVNNLLQTSAALQLWPPQGKAQVVANIINAYGVDVGMLADLLDGKQAPAAGPGAWNPQQPQPNPQQVYHDPRVDELMTELKTYREQTTQQAAVQADRALEEFAASHEYVDDVLDEMADMLELASKRGVELSWEDAYNRAVIATRPDIAEILRQKEEAQAAQNPNGQTAKAMAASSSVKGAAGKPTNQKPKTTREALEAAYDFHAGRGRA